MVVLVTNLTDAPGHPKGPVQVDIYNKTLDPGASIKIPADLVDKKIRSLANGEAPLISIGNLPPWYITAKKRTGRPLSKEERQKMQVTPPPPVIQMKPSKEKEYKKEKEKPVEILEEVRTQTKG